MDSNRDKESMLTSIDRTQFEELREILEEDFECLIIAYIEDSQKRVEELHAAVISNDNKAGFEVAHSLKGASANVGATRLNEYCYNMEGACRANTIGEQNVLLNSISDEVGVVNNEIMQLL